MDERSHQRDLPFETFSQFQEGYKSNRYLVGMYPRLGLLARALPWQQSLLCFPLIFSPFLFAVGFTAFGLATGRWWFTLAIGIAWLDYRTSTGALNLFRLLQWLPVALLGLVICLFYRPLGEALLVLGIGFIPSSLLCSAGLGIAKMTVEQQVTTSEEQFHWAYRAGLIVVVDCES